jgi:nitrogen regulatory protein P-II 2
MKLVIAMIRPHQLPAVKQALYKADVLKMTVTTALGQGEEKGFTETYRGAMEEVNLLKKIRLEVAVTEPYLEPTIAAIVEAAQTGEVGDGKIFVIEMLECVRIRTGERGQEAIG